MDQGTDQTRLRCKCVKLFKCKCKCTETFWYSKVQYRAQTHWCKSNYSTLTDSSFYVQ